MMLVIGHINNINLISAFYGISASSKLFQNRASNAFVYKISGQSLYTFSNKEILLSQGEVLFIPQGESFHVKRVCPEESRYSLINFYADIKNPVPFLCPLVGGIDYSFLFDEIIKTWIFESDANFYNRLSLFYKLLFSLSSSDERTYYNNEKKQSIEPAIQYLNQHIFDSSLKTEHLHTLCNISDTYFRKIFISVFGVSPKQYIINKRLLQAKNIIDGGEYNTIYEVSEAVGYTDALYFGKLFKKHYGYSPSKGKKGM
ncbi:MAG: helix-turn-helix transcriptional regulator [Clostridia bacterium]|nr:helix-turn-helix transcriptional regulator [Clostridia bacterium]